MEVWIQAAGIACSVYFVVEVVRLARAATLARRFGAHDLGSGRRLELRIDRRRGERRGVRTRMAR